MVGTTGAGKTTFARRLAERLDCVHIELDAHYWGPAWTPRRSEEFVAAVGEAAANDRWTSDGNYHKVRDLLWSRATTLVWLDYSIGTVLSRLLARTVRRAFTREELWNGNRENLWGHLTSRDSLFLWALKTHWRRRRTYGALLAEGRYPHLEVYRFYTPAQAEAWLVGLDPKPDVRKPGSPHRPLP